MLDLRAHASCSRLKQEERTTDQTLVWVKEEMTSTSNKYINQYTVRMCVILFSVWHVPVGPLDLGPAPQRPHPHACPPFA